MSSFGTRGARKGAPPQATVAAGPRMYLTLADGGELATDQRSLPRKAFLVLAALLVFLVAPLYWAGAAQAGGANDPQAVLVKQSDDDEDNDGDNEDEDDGETGNNDTGTRGETVAANTDQPGLETGVSTRGETDAGDGTGQTEADQTTNRETAAANTDRAGLNTGVSTRGETDPGDNTGQTERR